MSIMSMSQPGRACRNRVTNASAPAEDSDGPRGRAAQVEQLRHATSAFHGDALSPSALITASALVTMATFCIAKLIEALCHSAFMVEQQSSGTIMK